MGADWDKAVPHVEVWRECLRILKPGAFAFVMSSPRADVLSQMIIRLSKAGFRTDFTSIYWAYASGFPKSLNISRAVDRKFGAPASHQAKTLEGSYGGFQPKPSVEVILVVMKPLSEKTMVEQALSNGKGVTWLGETRIPFVNKDDEREHHYNAQGMDRLSKEYGEKLGSFDGGWMKKSPELSDKGRFPANLIASGDVLNDGRNHYSCQNDNPELETFNLDQNLSFPPMTKRQPYEYNDDGSFTRFFSLDLWFEKRFKKLPAGIQRTFPFMIVPKACKSERNRGLEKLQEGVHGHGDFGNSEGFERFATRAKNTHSTVKPLALMSYLITLGSRPKDLVLDCFVGSGTTCLAAKMLGRNAIGIERNKEYVEIAKARLNSFHTLDYFIGDEGEVVA